MRFRTLRIYSSENCTSMAGFLVTNMLRFYSQMRVSVSDLMQ